jgi:phospholipid transport system substrate-binding protein
MLMHGLRSVVCAVVLLAASAAHAAQEPRTFIDQLGEEVIGVLNDQGIDQAGRAERFRTLFAEAFDLPAISQFVLGRHWREAAPEQRAEWQEVLKDYVANLYARQFSTYEGQRFEIVRERPLDGSTVVQTRIQRADGQPLDVDFRVQRSGDELKIVDVLVANVSLIVTKRSEFDSVIQREGVDGLMRRLRQKSADLAPSW